MNENLVINFDAPRMQSIIMDTFDQIQVVLPHAIALEHAEHGGFRVYESGGQPLAIREVSAENPQETNSVTIELMGPVDVRNVYLVDHPAFQPHRIWFRKVLDDLRFTYTGDDLGATYTPERTHFRVWAPTANEVELILYNSGESIEGQRVLMTPSEKGTWTIHVEGDWHGYYYTYRVHVHGYVREAVDPYAKAVNMNGTKGAILDLRKTNPHGWGSAPRPQLVNFVDAIIYETHIRDLSIAENSGMQHKGKFLALTEENTHSPDGLATGLAHLRELGITHLHLLPIMESEFILDDENHYNWGYGTNFFFATEGQYVTDPGDPVKRVKEFKEAVQALHRNGIRVVLDVVYNHTGRVDHDLERIVPGYYLRRFEDGELSCGSGVNNDVASERPMVRKLIVDSVRYWVEEYQVDGFRFDLMGLHDRETMRQIEEVVHAIDPTILLYGEAWNIPTGGLPLEMMMVKNSQRGTTIGIFNDNVRDAILSGGMTPVWERGYVSGKPWQEASLKKVVVGSIEHDPNTVFNVSYRGNQLEEIHTTAPHETINYVTCHDNFAMRDRLEHCCSDASDEDRQRMAMLANGIILTSQGIAFLAGGVELYKTKQGVENSYESPDEINEIDWANKRVYQQMFQYYRGLIQLRKEHPAFRMPTARMIHAHLAFYDTPAGTILFTLNGHANGDPWKTIAVAYNQKPEAVPVQLPSAGWNVVVEDTRAGVTPLRYAEGSQIDIPPISMIVLYQD